MRPWRALAGIGLAALGGPSLAAPARAPWTTCGIEHAVLVVPAKVAGLTGAFILDTGAAQSQIDATQASLAGLVDDKATVKVRVGGVQIDRVAVTILELDDRTRALPTPITGVLGADVLGGLALDVRPDPCRFRLGAARSPGGRVLADLPVAWRGGVPYVSAGVSDGTRAERGLFRIATGADLAVRLSPDIARLEGGPANAPDATAPLRALSLGPLLLESPEAGVAASSVEGVPGEIGEPVWARYDVRLDPRRGRLTLFAPKRRTRRRGSGGS